MGVKKLSDISYRDKLKEHLIIEEKHKPTVEFESADSSFIYYFLSICELLDSGRIFFSPEGVDIKGFEPAHCTHTHLHYDSKDFDKFKCEKTFFLDLYLKQLGRYKKFLLKRSFGFKINSETYRVAFKKDFLVNVFSQILKA